MTEWNDTASNLATGAHGAGVLRTDAPGAPETPSVSAAGLTIIRAEPMPKPSLLGRIMSRLSGWGSSRPPETSPAAPAGPRLADTPGLDGPDGGDRVRSGRPGRLARSVTTGVRRTAAGLLLMFAALAGAAGQVHADVLVSNFGQTAASEVTTIQHSLAQKFTTGNNAQGYTLASVEFGTSTTDPSDTAAVTLRSVSNAGVPGSQIGNAFTGSLTNTSSTYTAPANTTLAANTSYFIVVERTGGIFSFTTTNETDEDTGGGSRLEHSGRPEVVQ